MNNDLKSELRNIIEKSRECLYRWLPFSETYWWDAPGRPGIGCFGTGFSDNWSVQTNLKYAGAMSVLATDPACEESRLIEHAKERAVAALRYSLSTHISGDAECSDGLQWGRTWISGLGIERMMHGIDRMDTFLDDSDREALQRVLCDEADWLSTGYKQVRASRWASEGGNHPESNLWNGAICARAALYYPGHPRAAQWMERAHLFLLNSISVPDDAEDKTIIAGKTLKDWHVGANFFANYALDHHGYLNVGYMIICLSNVAMLHYANILRGKSAPQSLYHHARDLWRFVTRLFFSDGRLLRIGGDTRIRYCYCQDYVIPVLALAADLWNDPHAISLLAGAVQLAKREQDISDDGRFLSSRLGHMPETSPLYFTRLEADRAVTLSQAVAWLSKRDFAPSAIKESYEKSVEGGWEEPEHGAIFHRSPSRFVSWSWRAAESPQGLCLPPHDGDLAEWRENLSGRVHGLGKPIQRTIHSTNQVAFHGGFVTCGAWMDRTSPELKESARDEDVAFHQIAFAALPDDHSVIRLEHASLPPRRVYLGGWEGVMLEIPNDLLNGNQRFYQTAQGPLSLPAQLGQPNTLELNSSWINIEHQIGMIGIYGAKSWTILQRGYRSGGSAMGNILTDTICYQFSNRPCDRFGPELVLDNGCMIIASINEDTTGKLAAAPSLRRLSCEGASNARAVCTPGRDGKNYILCANFERQEQNICLPGISGNWLDLTDDSKLTTQKSLTIAIPGGQARLLMQR